MNAMKPDVKLSLFVQLGGVFMFTLVIVYFHIYTQLKDKCQVK